MKSKTSPASASANASQPWNILGAAGQQQVAVATECATELFRGFEAMRKVQEQAAQAAARRHATVSEKLQGGCTPADLLALQSELFQFDVEGATKYWQQLGAAAMEMQTRMLGCVNHLVDSDAFLEAASAIDTATGREARR
jgi:hypothetical protein